MRWRFTDRVLEFEPWSRITGRKAISMEEYSLLKPFGRKGTFPESLVVESCVHLIRWLVARSSDFRQTALLRELRSFEFPTEAGMGDVLDIRIRLAREGEDGLRAECDVHASKGCVGRGSIGLRLDVLDQHCVPSDQAALWRELVGQA